MTRTFDLQIIEERYLGQSIEALEALVARFEVVNG